MPTTSPVILVFIGHGHIANKDIDNTNKRKHRWMLVIVTTLMASNQIGLWKPVKKSPNYFFSFQRPFLKLERSIFPKQIHFFIFLWLLVATTTSHQFHKFVLGISHYRNTKVSHTLNMGWKTSVLYFKSSGYTYQRN